MWPTAIAQACLGFLAKNTTNQLVVMSKVMPALTTGTGLKNNDWIKSSFDPWQEGNTIAHWRFAEYSECAAQPSFVSSFQNRELAQTLAPWGAILGHQKQTPDVERGDKCQTCWLYASLTLIVRLELAWVTKWKWKDSKKQESYFIPTRVETNNVVNRPTLTEL